jgi:4-amino-4-deoxy-L-arabinose transferase-like glycosyltransferase/predicted negative regulator of RcsB-dependent stress response
VQLSPAGRAHGRADIDVRTARWWLFAILAAALAIRLVYVFQSRASPLFDEPQMDALYHVEWARSLSRGLTYQAGPFFRAPGYPWFLAAVTRVFGDGLLAPRIVQALLGTASCALVYALGARLFDRRTGLCAAAIASAYAMLVYFDGELLLPVLEVPTCTAAVLFAVRFGDRPTWRRAAIAGVALGVAAIVRPNILLWGIAVALWMLARGGSPFAVRVREVAVYGCAALVPILPITTYNAVVGGDLVLISSQGGLNFWIGNNPTSDGSSAIAPGTRPDWWGGFHDVIAQAEAAEGRALRPSEVSGHYFASAWNWIADQPGAALRLLMWKLRLYWTDYELGNNQDEVFFAHEFGPVLRFDPVRFGVVAPLGLLGLLLTARCWRRLGPAWLFVPAWCASVVLFFVCARFRIPMIPVLGVFAAHALVVGLDCLRRREWTRLATGAALCIGLAFLVQQVPARVDRTPAKGLWQLGVLRFQAGELDEAERLLTASIAANPGFALSRSELGTVHLRQGRAAEALADFDSALRLVPDTISALQGRVEALWALQRAVEAAAAARAFAAAAPVLSVAQYTLARALWVLGDPSVHDEARAALLRAAESASNDVERFNAHFLSGEIERGAGRVDAAVAQYDAALASRPAPDDEGWYWRCQSARLSALVAGGESSRAASEARALLERWPGDARARTSVGGFLDR